MIMLARSRSPIICQMNLFLQVVAIIFINVSLCWAQAPGDEDVRCTEEHSSPPTYPDTERNLMDSFNYEQLLPGNGTGDDPIPNAVWNDFSFDDNDTAPELFNPTYVSFVIIARLLLLNHPHFQWQQRSGGLCRFQSQVCGWMQGIQDNWLFTQHIRQDFNSSSYNYDVTIHVMISFSTQNCRERHGCKPWLNLHHYMTNSVQLPSTEGSGYMNPENYEKFGMPMTTNTITTHTFILDFNLPPTYTGFYIALQDTGACITLSRLRVYRGNCKTQQIGLVLYPDAPAPAASSVNVNFSCVENAVISGTEIVTCLKNGSWSSANNPVCQCIPGYALEETENSSSKCVGKPNTIPITVLV